MNIPITTFNNGEVTQKIDCRTDTQKYASSCRILNNFLPLIYGCVEKRPGTKFISRAIDIALFFSYILSYENSIVCYENNVVTTNSSDLMSDFVCYDNDVVCYENEPVVNGKGLFVDKIVCYENQIVFYENSILTN